MRLNLIELTTNPVLNIVKIRLYSKKTTTPLFFLKNLTATDIMLTLGPSIFEALNKIILWNRNQFYQY